MRDRGSGGGKTGGVGEWGQGDADPRKVETRDERGEHGGRKEVDRSERDETVHLNFSFLRPFKRSKKHRLPTSAVKFGSIVVSLCAAEMGRTHSGQVVHRGSGHVNTQQVHLHWETLTGCRFCNGFYALSPKTCLRDEGEGGKKDKRRYLSDKTARHQIKCLLNITQRKWRRRNSPHYIVYIVSVHAFKSLCWKAHSYDVWVDICDGGSEGNGPRRATAGHRTPGRAAGSGGGRGITFAKYSSWLNDSLPTPPKNCECKKKKKKAGQETTVKPSE